MNKTVPSSKCTNIRLGKYSHWKHYFVFTNQSMLCKNDLKKPNKPITTLKIYIIMRFQMTKKTWKLTRKAEIILPLEVDLTQNTAWKEEPMIQGRRSNRMTSYIDSRRTARFYLCYNTLLTFLMWGENQIEQHKNIARVDVLQRDPLTPNDIFGNLPPTSLNLQAVSWHEGIAVVSWSFHQLLIKLIRDYVPEKA